MTNYADFRRIRSLEDTCNRLGFKLTNSRHYPDDFAITPKGDEDDNEMTLPIYNSTLKLAGKYTWNNITLAVRDDASNTVAKLVGEQLQKQFDFVEMASASSGIDYKFLTKIEILDGGNGASTPTVLETWELYGCYLQGANYGDLNYGSSEAAQVEMTIVYDNANQTPLGTGVGSTVARTLGDVVTGAGGQVGAA